MTDFYYIFNTKEKRAHKLETLRKMFTPEKEVSLKEFFKALDEGVQTDLTDFFRISKKVRVDDKFRAFMLDRDDPNVSIQEILEWSEKNS